MVVCAFEGAKGAGPKGISYPIGAMKRTSVALTGTLRRHAAMTQMLIEIRRNAGLLTTVIVGVTSNRLDDEVSGYSELSIESAGPEITILIAICNVLEEPDRTIAANPDRTFSEVHH